MTTSDLTLNVPKKAEEGHSPDAGRLPSNAYFIWRMIAYAPLQYTGMSLWWILFHAWPLIPGLLAKFFFDTLSGSAPAGLTLWSVLALVFVAGLARAGIVGGATATGAPWMFRMQALFQRNLLARILARPGAKSIPGTVGEAISTLRDDVEAMHMMSGWAFDVVAGLILAVGAVAILFSIDARITLLVFVPIVLVILLANAVRARAIHLREQSRESTAQVTGFIGEIFGKVQTVQVAGVDEWVLARLEQLGEKRRQAQLRDSLQTLALDAVFINIANLGAGLTLLVTAGQMRTGTFSVGDFALFAAYLMQVADYTGFLGYLITTYRQSGVAYQRGATLLQGAPATDLVAYHPIDLRPQATIESARALSVTLPRIPLQRLTVKGLTFLYPDSRRGIEDVSFTLERGAITVVTGAIGSGKSTLLRALLGLLDAQVGEIWWNEKRVLRPSDFMIPPQVGYTSQTPMLLSGTLAENILLGLNGSGHGAGYDRNKDDKSTEELVASAIKNAVLEEDVAGFAYSTQTEIGVRGLRLSGGQIQRTAAARMFVRQPELLVIDDLSSALDVETEQRLWQRILALNTTALIVSHRPYVLSRADQLLKLEDGRLVKG
jgi:ATP-binding cassette subfamily B protein